MQSNLTPTLTEAQLKQNIDALQGSKMSTANIQSYVNNYAKGADGNYTLKGSQTAAPDDRNIVQKTLGTFLDPIIESGVHTGEAIADVGLTGINKLTGGALDKYTPEGNLSQALQRVENGPVTAPVIGTKVTPAKDLTVENVAGNAASTVGLGVDSPVLAGAMLAGGQAAKDNASIGTVAASTVAGAIGGKILEYGFKAVAPYVEKAALKYGTPFLEGISKYIPESATKFMSDLSSKASAVVDNTKIVPDVASTVIDKTQSVAGKAADAVVTPVVDAPANVLSKTQSAISRANVPANLESSVQRIASAEPVVGADGEAIPKESPLELYDKYARQEQLYKGGTKEDIAAGRGGAKEDMAIGQVGEDMGSAYEDVIKQRRQAGTDMGAEMSKIGDTNTDVTAAFPKFEEELNKSGIQYDAKNKKVVLSPTSKATAQDGKLLTNYVKQLNKLGAQPTAAELDAFLSRIPKELDVFKADNNITKMTNAERMINGNLADLSAGLTAKANPAFADFEAAKAKYADLSQFLRQGEGVVGKVTADGDYAKDASSLKSAVVSVLNNGKKDWLLKLEDLTGQPILDKTVLALQAMKDAGNTKGGSLLDILNPGSEVKLPTSKSGIIDKTLSTGVKIAKKKLVGDATEQTRRFIMDTMNKVAK